ncbi:MAG: hypothetical protein GY944_29510, partial [bacterium]|nr:hypothetical protein [bacterium]
YDATIGAFLTPDQVYPYDARLQSSHNLYAYVNGDPINQVWSLKVNDGISFKVLDGIEGVTP